MIKYMYRIIYRISCRYYDRKMDCKSVRISDSNLRYQCYPRTD